MPLQIIILIQPYWKSNIKSKYIAKRTDSVRFLFYTITAADNKTKGELNMEDIEVKLARFEQRVETLERDVVVIKDIQTEIRTISETLVTLASEIKHTNEHLAKQEHKIDVIEQQPRQRLQQIVTAIIAALAGGLISTIIAFIIK